jgi:phosphoglucosamine mutase
MKMRGVLNGDTLVSTVMSNLGLERALAAKGIGLVRVQVGDRYVVEAMREGGYNIGGEQSGHIVLSDYSTTGDGLLAALQVLALVKQQGRPASEALSVFTPLPQVLRNVKFEKSAKPLDNTQVQAAIRSAQEQLTKGGRLLVRASGTEPVIRVMAEGDDAAMVENVVGDLCAVIEKAVRKA